MSLNFCDSHHVSPSDLANLLCNCFVIFEIVIEFCEIMASFVVQVAFAVFHAIAFGFGKLFLNTVYWTVWLVFHFVCGILGLEDKSTSAFSWLIVMGILFVYCDRQHHDWLVKLSRLVTVYMNRWQTRFENDPNQIMLYNEIVLENQRNEHLETEPINRQLEEENRENENEENNLVEADRHRVDNDNRRNIARENGADNHRASIENRQNVERERQNTRTTLENRRNRTQEQHRYFLRQRNRNRHLQEDRQAVAQYGVGAIVLPGQNVLNMLQPNRNVGAVARNARPTVNNASNVRERMLRELDGSRQVVGIQADGNPVLFGRTRQGVPHRDGGSMPHM